MISEAFLASSILALTSINVSAQDPHRSPNHPLNVPATDAEVRDALQSPSHDLKQLTIRRAGLLPAHTLQTDTVKAVSAEIDSVTEETRRRFKDHPLNVNESNNNFEYVVALSEVLIKQGSPAGIDGLAAVVHIGPPLYALMDFGEKAVPALVNAATRPEDEPGHAKAAMDALTQILKRRPRDQEFAPARLASIKAVASDWLASARGDDEAHTLIEAASLAVATGDTALRGTVASLVDNDGEFVRRGMSVRFQQLVIGGARTALEESPR